MDNFVNNVKDLLDDIYYNYTIIIYKGGVMRIMLAIYSGIYCQRQTQLSIIPLKIPRMIGIQGMKF